MSNVAHYRKLRGLTQDDLADKVGVSQPHISRIEKGDDGVPLSLFKTIADALGVKLYDLFSEEMAGAEVILLDAYRRVSPQIRKSWVEMARVAVDQPPLDDQ